MNAVALHASTEEHAMTKSTNTLVTVPLAIVGLTVKSVRFIARYFVTS